MLYQSNELNYLVPASLNFSNALNAPEAYSLWASITPHLMEDVGLKTMVCLLWVT